MSRRKTPDRRYPKRLREFHDDRGQLARILLSAPSDARQGARQRGDILERMALDPTELGADRIRPLRRAEYDRLVELGVFDEDEHVELLRGQLVQMSPQGAPHAGITSRLTMLFAPAVVGRAEVRVASPFAATDDSEPEPDLAIVPPSAGLTEHPSRAFLLIEVSDSSVVKDRKLKASVYAEAGVPEYWVVNVRERCIEVFAEPSGATYRRIERVTSGKIAPKAFPDVTVDVAALLNG